MLLSAVSVLVVAQSSSEIPEGLMNNPVYTCVVTRNSRSEPSKVLCDYLFAMRAKARCQLSNQTYKLSPFRHGYRFI